MWGLGDLVTGPPQAHAGMLDHLEGRTEMVRHLGPARPPSRRPDPWRTDGSS